jgi:hypothetical protein
MSNFDALSPKHLLESGGVLFQPCPDDPPRAVVSTA